MALSRIHRYLSMGTCSKSSVAGSSDPGEGPYCVSMDGSVDCMLYAQFFEYSCYALVPLVNVLRD